MWSLDLYLEDPTETEHINSIQLDMSLCISGLFAEDVLFCEFLGGLR